MMASPFSTRFATARFSNLAVVALAGVLAWSSGAPQSAQAQDDATSQQPAVQQAPAAAKDEAAKLVLGDDLREVVPDLAKEIGTYLGKRQTRRVVIEGLDGAEPLVERVVVRNLTAGLKSKGILVDPAATTRIKGRLIERQVGSRKLAVLEWCLQDRTGFELCSMRQRLSVTGPLVVEADEEVIAARTE